MPPAIGGRRRRLIVAYGGAAEIGRGGQLRQSTLVFAVLRNISGVVAAAVPAGNKRGGGCSLEIKRRSSRAAPRTN
jgi:hypothetical protein